ncbi:MAG: monovalent cation/H(+) antiporter subunit G [Waddliaceae bacterium]
MTFSNIASLIFTGIGVIFFFAGTLGLIRFPDVYTRLHALTKADNLGLGFVVLGLAIKMESFEILVKLLFIWQFVLFSSATSCYLIAREGLKMNIKPKTKL